jgi:hypothetical protein
MSRVDCASVAAVVWWRAYRVTSSSLMTLECGIMKAQYRSGLAMWEHG